MRSNGAKAKYVCLSASSHYIHHRRDVVRLCCSPPSTPKAHYILYYIILVLIDRLYSKLCASPPFLWIKHSVSDCASASPPFSSFLCSWLGHTPYPPSGALACDPYESPYIPSPSQDLVPRFYRLQNGSFVLVSAPVPVPPHWRIPIASPTPYPHFATSKTVAPVIPIYPHSLGFFLAVIHLVLPRLSPLAFDLGENEYSSVPRLCVTSFTALQGASSSPSLCIAALAARDGYLNAIFRFNCPAKGDSSTYTGYRPHSHVSVPLKFLILLPSPPCTRIYLIPVLHCLNQGLHPHSPSQYTGGGVLNSMTPTGLFFRVTARR
ncbi:hypothetical protein C8J57DRAFT_1557784 [Mycena rebaudengoi]|nr:hypothetical protein C8J57DRAFT_1557784 [Mycena rebaudengoi]